MVEFKVGDKVKKKDGSNFSHGKPTNTVSNWKGYYPSADRVWLAETDTHLAASDLELVSRKHPNPFLIEQTTYKLNRGAITKKLKSGNIFGVSGGTLSFTIVHGHKESRVSDIPEIIQHLQDFYDAVQLEGKPQ